MRKYLFISFVYLFIFGIIFVSSFGAALASSNEPLFYKITAENTVLYAINDSGLVTENALCILPTTYFVKPNKSLDDDYLSVSYLGITGAVKIDALVPVYSTPTTPYSVQTFDLLKTANATVWSKPTTESQYLTSISYGTTSIVYVGSVDGQKISADDSGVWYLCKFVDPENGTQFGYIHASLTTNLTPFVSNTEEVELEPIVPTNANILAPELSNTNNLLLILLLTIPAVIILLLIIKPKRSKSAPARRKIKSLTQLNLPDNKTQNDFDF